MKGTISNFISNVLIDRILVHKCFSIIKYSADDGTQKPHSYDLFQKKNYV